MARQVVVVFTVDKASNTMHSPVRTPQRIFTGMGSKAAVPQKQVRCCISSLTRPIQKNNNYYKCSFDVFSMMFWTRL